MVISVNSLLKKFIWVLTVFLFSSFLIFETFAWGKYAFFGASIMVVLLSVVIHGGVLRLRIQPFHIFMAVFSVYVGFSSLWAINSGDAINKATTLVQILVCAAMLYVHYDREDNIKELLSAVKWAGYIVTIYAIMVYGLDQMLASSQDIRLETEFSNVNTIAMAAALSCTIQWSELTNRRSFWSVALMVPAVILITATQSRKALVQLIAGIFGVYAMNTAQQKGFVKKIIKVVLYSVVLYVGLRFLFSLDIFSGSMARMEGLLNFWSDEGKVDHSTILRNDMQELGIQYWKENPILGIGMGCPHILAAQYLNFDAYLHNNYVELLCGGGVVAFALYYAMFVYLAVSLFKYRKADKDAFGIGMIWLGLMLLMNFGMVTYYSKTQWYYLLIHFINVSQLKRKHREMMENAQESVSEGN